MRTDDTNVPNLASQAEKDQCKITIWHNTLTHLLHIECRAQYYFAALKQTTSWERYHQVRMSSSRWELSPGPDVYLFWKYANLHRVFFKWWACRSTLWHKIDQYLQSRHLHAVERHTNTMVFWTSFPQFPLHFGDWPPHLDRCHRSEWSDHRTW